MVRPDYDERIRRATFGSSVSTDVTRFKGFFDSAIEDFSRLSKENYLLIIEFSRRESRSLVHSLDGEVKRGQEES